MTVTVCKSRFESNGFNKYEMRDKHLYFKQCTCNNMNFVKILRAEVETHGRQWVSSCSPSISIISNKASNNFFELVSLCKVLSILIQFSFLYTFPSTCNSNFQIKKNDRKNFNFHDFTLSHLDRGWLMFNKITNYLKTETDSVL